MITSSDPTVTYSELQWTTVNYSDLQWLTVTYSDPKVTYIYWPYTPSLNPAD